MPSNSIRYSKSMIVIHWLTALAVFGAWLTAVAGSRRTPSELATTLIDELRIACRAFDRVFRAGRYWVPQWYSASHRIAYWDVFAHPTNIPRYANGVGAPELWWTDEAKARKPEQSKPEPTKPGQAK